MRIMSILFILACAASLSAQEADGNTATTIRALEHEWVDGQSRNNNRALNLIFDNALVYVEYGQLVTKGDYLARIKQEATQIAMEAIPCANLETLPSSSDPTGKRSRRAGSAR